MYTSTIITRDGDRVSAYTTPYGDKNVILNMTGAEVAAGQFVFAYNQMIHTEFCRRKGEKTVGVTIRTGYGRLGKPKAYDAVRGETGRNPSPFAKRMKAVIAQVESGKYTVVEVSCGKQSILLSLEHHQVTDVSFVASV